MLKQILDHFRTVPPDSLWGEAVRVFLLKEEEKTLEDCFRLMRQLQSQMRDNEVMMQNILGPAFQFIRDFKIPEPLRYAR